jgi:hypothetical protein
MNLNSRRCGVVLCLLAGVVVGLTGCKMSGVQAAGSGSGDSLSGPPTWNAEFTARNPRVCTKLMTPPNASQAKALVQCDHEGRSILTGMNPVVFLVTDLTVEVAAPRKFMMSVDAGPDIDVTAPVYPIQGIGTGWRCLSTRSVPAGQNCGKHIAAPGVGECWRTPFGDWRCSMTVGSRELPIYFPEGPRVY